VRSSLIAMYSMSCMLVNCLNSPNFCMPVFLFLERDLLDFELKPLDLSAED
jgi:hypothetical protein